MKLHTNSEMSQELKTVIWISLISGPVFIPFLGGIPLFDWDEVNFAEAAREMILTGDYSRVYIDFVPFWEKPPLFFWLQAIAMKFFGINEFAARLPNAICGVVTLNILYLIGRRLFDHRFGLLWVLAYGGSILPHLYFRSGIIDPWFNLFIFLSIYFLIWSGQERSLMAGGRHRIPSNEVTERDEDPAVPASISGLKSDVRACLGGIFIGLAVLTKGPVAFLVVLLTVGTYWLIRRSRASVKFRHSVLYSITGLITFGLWYGVETLRNGPSFVVEFMNYQAELLVIPGAGHAGFPGYHLVVLLVGCFPASVLCIRPIFKRDNEEAAQLDFRIWMVILLAIVIILFSFVRSKIVHYSSLCYFPLTYLATLYIWQKVRSERRVGLLQRLVIAFIGLLYVMMGIVLVYLGHHPGLISALVPLDENTSASLTMDIDWRWRDGIPVLFMLGAIFMAWKMNPFQVMRYGVLMYVCVAAFVYTGIICWVGKVQQYTQGPATEFFTLLAGKDVYAVPWGHKSYSQYWDFKKPMPESFEQSKAGADEVTYSRLSDPHYLLTSVEVSKDVYVITKAAKADDFQSQYPHVKKIGERGGFVFFIRESKESR